MPSQDIDSPNLSFMYKVSLKGKKGEKWRSTSNNWIPKDKDFEKEKKHRHQMPSRVVPVTT